MALKISCPDCSKQVHAEQALGRCPSCRYIDPCCDGATLASCETRAPETQSQNR